MSIGVGDAVVVVVVAVVGAGDEVDEVDADCLLLHTSHLVGVDGWWGVGKITRRVSLMISCWYSHALMVSRQLQG